LLIEIFLAILSININREQVDKKKKDIAAQLQSYAAQLLLT